MVENVAVRACVRGTCFKGIRESRDAASSMLINLASNQYLIILSNYFRLFIFRLWIVAIVATGILRESCGNNHTVNLLSLLLFALSSSDYIIILFYSLLFDFALVPPPVPGWPRWSNHLAPPPTLPTASNPQPLSCDSGDCWDHWQHVVNGSKLKWVHAYSHA